MFAKEELEGFRFFDPKRGNESEITKSAGIYAILLRPGSTLPEIEIGYTPCIVEYKGDKYELIYVGISKKSLYKRDYLTHFQGNNAGRSTLRKSIGSLMGLEKTYRSEVEKDKGKPKIKFIDSDEEKLSEWMKENLLLLYKADEKCEEKEKEMIMVLNPPLNISKNTNNVNNDYRNKLKSLRTDRSDLK